MSEDNNKELVLAMQVLEKEKGISPEIIKETLEAALVLAYKKKYNQAQNVEVNFDIETGQIKVYSVKEVVETNYDSTLEISLDEALKINPHYEIGDRIKFEVTPTDFGRLATQTAKQTILQRLRDAERESLYEEYIQYEDEIMIGTVDRQDNNFIYVDLGKVAGLMPKRDQIPGEVYEMDDRIKVYVTKVEKSKRGPGPRITVSRAQPEFLRRLFEQEVPEIYDGIVEIMSIAREAGDRSKVAVRSRDKQIDAVGTCVGQGGSRVNAIVNELSGENMDIVEYNDDPKEFIKNAMSPAQVVDVIFEDESEKSTIVVVPDYQLSLAIGKRGQNARLAALLTGYRIDIKSESDYEAYLNEKEALAEEANYEEEVEIIEEMTGEDADLIESSTDFVSFDDYAMEQVDTVDELLTGEIDYDRVEDAADLMRVNDEQNYSPEEYEEMIDAVEAHSVDDESYDELEERLLDESY